jgi:hypothetical protein
MPRLTALYVYPLKSAHRLSPPSAEVEPWGLAGDRRWMLADPEGRFVSQRELPRLALVRAEPQPGGGLLLSMSGAEPLLVRPPAAEHGDRLADVQVWRSSFQAAEAAKEAHAWFSALFCTDLRLVHLDDPVRRSADPEYAPGAPVSMADGFPLLLTTTASLDDLNKRIAADHPGNPAQAVPLPMERFRPNAVVEGTRPWVEDGWRRIRIGEVVFRVVKPCTRCVITTTDQDSGERLGPEPLRSLARQRRFGTRAVFGQNLVPERPEGLAGEVLGTLRTGDELTVLEEGPCPAPDA